MYWKKKNFMVPVVGKTVNLLRQTYSCGRTHSTKRSQKDVKKKRTLSEEGKVACISVLFLFHQGTLFIACPPL